MSESLSPNFTNPLEDTLLDALAHSTPKVAKKPRDPSLRSGRFDHRQWADGPENWTRVRGVALIHEDTQTLLGNFSEFKHTRYPDAERWVRELEPLLIEGTKYVSGPQWVPTERVLDVMNRATEFIMAIIDISLPELGMRTAAAEVRVELLWGGMNRVELCERTEFHSLDLTATLWLPKGLDVLNGMSLDSKLALRSEIGL